MTLFTTLLTGGVVYAGFKGLVMQKSIKWPSFSLFEVAKKRIGWAQANSLEVESSSETQALKKSNDALVISSISLGFATIGVLGKPFIGLASLPIVVYIFAPTFETAIHTLREERRITKPVLDATRVTVCIVMGYHFVAALDAWFQTLAQKWLTQDVSKFQDKLHEVTGHEEQKKSWLFVKGTQLELPYQELTPDDVIVVMAGEVIPATGRIVYGEAWINEQLVTGTSELIQKKVGEDVFASTLICSGKIYIMVEHIDPELLASTVYHKVQKTIKSETLIQKAGQQNGEKAMPLMMACFISSWPLIGSNHAAAFLTTSFGTQMELLTPLALQYYTFLAAQQGFIIKDGALLERLPFVNSFIFDAQILNSPENKRQVKELISQLRQRSWPITTITNHKFVVYLISSQDQKSSQQLANQLGFDDYFANISSEQKAIIIEQLQTGGHLVCYVGDGTKEKTAMQKAFVSISRHATTLEEDSSHLVWTSQQMNNFDWFLNLASDFTAKQSFSLITPFIFDLVDISTTLLLGWTLGTSILFTYSGLFVSMANIRAVQKQATRPAKEETNTNNAVILQTLGHYYRKR